MKLNEYLKDGADYQARATLMALQGAIGDGIQSSWNDERRTYEAEIEVDRWHNCREQGYIAYLSFYVGRKGFQLNIIWFEHRNSDNIHAVKWEQKSINPLTIANAEFGDIYKTKYDTSFSVSYDKYAEMAEWIKDQFVEFWDLHHQPPAGSP